MDNVSLLETLNTKVKAVFNKLFDDNKEYKKYNKSFTHILILILIKLSIVVTES